MQRITLTRCEAAEFIGIDVDTLTEWCRAGRIAYIRKNPSKKSLDDDKNRIGFWLNNLSGKRFYPNLVGFIDNHEIMPYRASQELSERACSDMLDFCQEDVTIEKPATKWT